VAPQHPRQAVEIAAPIELLRRRKVAGATGLERDQEARRLVVVLLLPADGQRCGQAFARHKREREVDEREMCEGHTQTNPRRVGIEIRRRIRDADVVRLDIEVNELQRMNLLERGEAMMRERPPVRAVLEDVPQHGAVAGDGQQRGPLIDGDARVVGLHLAHAALVAAVEPHDTGHAANSMSDQAREDPPFALGPLPEVGVPRFEKALGVAAPFTRAHGFAEDLDVLAGRHLETAAAEYSFNLLGRHGCTPECEKASGGAGCCAAALSPTRTTAIRATTAIRTLVATTRARRPTRRSSRCTASTVASSWLPPLRARSIRLMQRVASGTCSVSELPMSRASAYL